MELEWRTLQALELRDKNKMLTNIETFQPNDLVYCKSMPLVRRGLTFSYLFFTRSAASCINNAPLWFGHSR